MLVVPPATAYLLTDRLGVMLGLAVGTGIASALIGYGAARALDVSIAGAMASVAGLIFVAALLLSPGHGLLARMLQLWKMGRRLSGQLLLLHLRKEGEVVPAAMLERRFGWTGRRLQRVASTLLRTGLVEREGGGLRLTPKGAEVLETTGRAQLAHKL